MSEDPDQVVIVSLRASLVPAPMVEGSNLHPCANCKHDVWISPATQETRKKFPNAPVMCITCVLAELGVDDA